MNKLDIIRVIAAMPDNTQVMYGHNGALHNVHSIEIINGCVVFQQKPRQSEEKPAKVLPEG